MSTMDNCQLGTWQTTPNGCLMNQEYVKTAAQAWWWVQVGVWGTRRITRCGHRTQHGVAT